METPVEIVAVDPQNLAARSFFCRKSKMKTVGNLRKLTWVAEQLGNGLGIEILYEAGRSVGFIEYAPGEHAWRAVHAPGYLVIHCIWVVGRAKGKGHGAALLERAEAHARESGLNGVAMVTSSGLWLADNQLLLAHGYEPVAEAPPSFQLMVKSFRKGPQPTFPDDWDRRAAAFGDGLTIVTTDQCPYLDDAEQATIKGAQQLGIPVGMVKLATARDVQARSPSAFGAYSVVLDGQLLTYHYLLERDLVGLVSAQM